MCSNADESNSARDSLSEFKESLLGSKSLPDLVMSLHLHHEPDLALCASEDVVRKRYNRVMGVDDTSEGWRAAMSQGVRNVSSTLRYLMQHPERSLQRSKLRRKPSQTDAEFARQLIRQEEERKHVAMKANLRCSKEEVDSVGELELSLAAARILKRRDLPDVKTGNAAAAKRHRHRRRKRDAASGSVFPSWLWNRPDFQAVYEMPEYELCLDTLQKPGDERSEYEIDALYKFLSGAKILKNLSGELGLELLRLGGLQVRPKGSILYKRKDPVHLLYIVRSGVLELTDVESGHGRSSLRLSSGDSCGLPIDLQKDADDKRLRRRPAASRRWEMLRKAFNKENDGKVPDAKQAGEDAMKDVAREIPEHRDSARCLSDCVLVTLPYPSYMRLMAEQRACKLSNMFRFLCSLHVFASWSTGRIRRLASVLKERKYVKQQTITQQGDECDYLFFVYDGEVSLTRVVHIMRKNQWPATPSVREVVRSTNAMSYVVDVVPKNDFFGEEALLGVRRCPTTAVCLSETATLLYLKRKDFVYLFHEPTVSLFKRRQEEAREFAFFKIYSSLQNVHSIENLHSIDVLDDDEVAFRIPSGRDKELNEANDIGSGRSPRRSLPLTSRGGDLSSLPVSRGKKLTRRLERITSKRSLRRLKHSATVPTLPPAKRETREEKRIRQQKSMELLEQLSHSRDQPFEEPTIIAIRHHLSVLLRKRSRSRAETFSKRE